jgi:hypothetical protein
MDFGSIDLTKLSEADLIGLNATTALVQSSPSRHGQAAFAVVRCVPTAVDKASMTMASSSSRGNRRQPTRTDGGDHD